MQYPIAAPDLSGNEGAYVDECLRTSWISSKGRFIGEFEARFAAYIGVRHAVATCNGTVALHLALAAHRIGPGDEVIVPALTYVATANAVAYTGATPVFADADPATWCVSPESVRALVTPRTRAVIPVHLYGHPCDMTEIRAIAAERGLIVIEDCAEALGAEWEGRRVGRFGDAGMFSFFGNKVLTTGEGGMVVTDDDALATRLRLLRGQGMDPDRRYWFPVLGYNYRMTNIAAAIGVGQMEHIDDLLRHRLRIAARYAERLAGVPGVTLPPSAPRAKSIYWLFSILVDSRARRDRLMANLEADGIETRPFFTPMVDLPMYRENPSDRGCPVARDLADRGLNLPTSSYLDDAAVDHIARCARTRLEQA